MTIGAHPSLTIYSCLLWILTRAVGTQTGWSLKVEYTSNTFLVEPRNCGRDPNRPWK